MDRSLQLAAAFTLKALPEIANLGYPFVASDADFTSAPPPKKVVKAKNWPPGKAYFAVISMKLLLFPGAKA